MTDTVSRDRWLPRFKVLYLLAISIAVYLAPAMELTRPFRWIIVLSLLLLQAAILTSRIPVSDVIRPIARLRWLFAFLAVCYVFLPGGPDDQVWNWQPFQRIRPISFNITGLETAALMCVQIATVILVSVVVRVTGSNMDLVDGLRGLGAPRLFALSVDTTLALLGGIRPRGSGGGGGMGRRGGGRGGGSGGGGGGGGGRRGRDACEGVSDGDGTSRVNERDERRDDDAARQPDRAAVSDRGNSPIRVLGRILRGDVGFFVESIESSLARAREQVGQVGAGLDERLVHDASVVSGVSLAMMSLKLLKVLPGVPFLPGWKTLFFYPLYILAAELSYSRWGGTTAGCIMGVVGYLQGDGRYGVFEILKHAVPGIVIDLVWPWFRRFRRSAFVYCLLGFITAIARTATEFTIIFLMQARLEAYLFVVPTLVSNLIAGTLSGLVTFLILPVFRGKVAAAAPSTELAADQAVASSAADQRSRRQSSVGNAADPADSNGAGAARCDEIVPRESCAGLPAANAAESSANSLGDGS